MLEWLWIPICLMCAYGFLRLFAKLMAGGQSKAEYLEEQHHNRAAGRDNRRRDDLYKAMGAGLNTRDGQRAWARYQKAEREDAYQDNYEIRQIVDAETVMTEELQRQLDAGENPYAHAVDRRHAPAGRAVRAR